MKTIEVVAAIITHGNRILAAQRGTGKWKDGWEFPGGKVEKGEKWEQALVRELREELDIEIHVEQLIDTIEFDYPEFHLVMHGYLCKIKKGSPVLKEHEAVEWLTKNQLETVKWLPADVLLIPKVKELLLEKPNKERIVEICCGSYYDAVQAAAGGARRIELNSALMLGGLTPTPATLKLVKQSFPDLKVVAMVRPRGAGFCYTEEEFLVMEAECQELAAAGADGIAFGCLCADGTLDMEKNKRLISLIKGAKMEAVFHRAFDCADNPFEAAEQLIGLEVDRVLTSGQQASAMDGAEQIRRLQAEYGDRIQILAGGGVNAENALELIEKTGIAQVHSSCKTWRTDPTTVRGNVSYSIAPGDRKSMYDVVSASLVRALVEKVENGYGETDG